MQGTTTTEDEEACYDRKNFEQVKRKNQIPNKYAVIFFRPLSSVYLTLPFRFPSIVATFHA